MTRGARTHGNLFFFWEYNSVSIVPLSNLTLRSRKFTLFGDDSNVN